VSKPNEVPVTEPGASGGGGLRSIVVIAGGTFGIQAMLLVTGIISARLLGVEGRGQIALVSAAALLLARVTMAGSLPVAVSQLLAREGLTARDGLRPFVLRWSAWALLPSLAAGGWLAWVLRDEGAGLQLGLSGATAGFTYLSIVGGILASAVQGELASAAKAVGGALLLQAPFFVLLSAFAALGWVEGPVTVAVLMVAGGLIGILLALRLLRPAEGRPSTLDSAEVRRVAATNYVNAVGTLNGIGIDRNLVGVWLGTAALGLYSVGLAFATMSAVLGNAVSSLLLPRLAAHHDHPEEQRRLARTWLSLTALLLALIVGALELVVEPVIRIAFGEEFVPAVEVARWLVLADGLFGFRRLLICLLQARGRGGIASAIELVLTVVMVAGIAVAGAAGELVLVGIVLACVAALACVALSVAVVVTRPRTAAGTRPRHRAGP